MERRSVVRKDASRVALRAVSKAAMTERLMAVCSVVHLVEWKDRSRVVLLVDAKVLMWVDCLDMRRAVLMAPKTAVLTGLRRVDSWVVWMVLLMVE